jgi:hypothetical protein
MTDDSGLPRTHPRRRLAEARKQIQLALDDAGDADGRLGSLPIVQDDDGELVVETNPEDGTVVIHDGRPRGSRRVELELDEAVLVAKAIEVGAFERL